MGERRVNKYLFQGFFPFNEPLWISFLYGQGGTFDFFFQRGGGQKGSQNKLKKRRGSSGGGITTKLK